LTPTGHYNQPIKSKPDSGQLNTDIYALRRAALAPLLPGPNTARLPAATAAALQQNREDLLALVLAQGLGPLWDHWLTTTAADVLDGTERDILRAARRNAAAHYLMQKHALAEVRHTLDSAGIAHVVIKGVQLREILYSEPALRVAADIDMLVAPEKRFAATRALVGAGFTPVINSDTISHEISLHRGHLDIDLHWDVLRPGRTRTPLAAEFVAQRRDTGSHWAPTPTATLFLMLVHPVISKYCTTPHASIIRVLDIALWLEEQSPDWEALADLLARAGLKAAAWIMLAWLRMLTGITAPEHFIRAVQPGPLRRTYLHHWLANDLSTRLLDNPLLIQLGFTLPAHDRPADALRATRRALAASREAEAQARVFRDLVP